MTTPAVNINTVQSVPSKYCYHLIKPTVGAETCVTGTSNKIWIRETRPVSGNAGRIKGFKKCRPWNHLKENWRQHGSTTSYVFINTLTGGELQYDYKDGSFWGASRPPAPVLPSGNMINTALNKALEKLKSPDIHLGNFAAEAQKTIDMYVTLAKRIAVQVRAFRYANPRDWLLAQRYEGSRDRGLWCLIPASWLELQYGWKPHMADLYGACNHLARRSRFGFPFTIVKGYCEDTTESSLAISGAAFGASATAVFRNVRKCGVQLVYGLTNQQLAELSSLGLINPAEIVWEQMRYSFVVDWVLPIGQWLSNLTADAGYTFVTGSLSKSGEQQFVSSSLTSRNPDGPSGRWIGGGTPLYSGRGFSFDRTCYLGSPVPGLYVKNPLSKGHMANAAALLTQAFFARE